jgi:hypothetical protein
MKIHFQNYYSITAEKISSFDATNKKNLRLKPSTPDFVVDYVMGLVSGAGSSKDLEEIKRRLSKPNPTPKEIADYTKLYEISDDVDVNRERNLLLAQHELTFCDKEINKIVTERERAKRSKKFPFISIEQADRLIDLESQKAKNQNQVAHIEKILNRTNPVIQSNETNP